MLVLIVGLGSIAQKHIYAIRALDSNAKIYALRSSKEALLVEGVINVYSLDEVPIEIDFVIISNPTKFHFETIERLSGLGVALFIEKPPSHALTGAETLLELLNVRNIPTYISCNLRFHPCIQFMKQYLQDGGYRINEVNIYCGSYLPEWRPGKNFRNIYSASEHLGGGVHLDLFHEMDYATWIFGMPLGCRGYRSSESSLEINSSDYANYLLKYNGFNLSVILNYYRRTPKRSLEIVFDDNTFVVDLIRCEILSDTGETIFALREYDLINSYVDQMRYFAECLKSDQKPMNNLVESMEVLKLSLKNESFS